MESQGRGCNPLSLVPYACQGLAGGTPSPASAGSMLGVGGSISSFPGSLVERGKVPLPALVFESVLTVSAQPPGRWPVTSSLDG